MDQPDHEDASTQAEIAKYLSERTKNAGISIPRLSTRDRVPLSFGQERLWFLYQLEKDSPAYNRPVILRLKGDLNQQLFIGCIHEILARHDVFKTVFLLERGEPTAKITQVPDLTFQVEDLAHYPPSERLPVAFHRMGDMIEVPFPLETGPLVRLHLFRLDQDEHILLFVTHHIIFDAWSETTFINELAASYQSLDVGEPPVQYQDYAQWQRKQISSRRYNGQLDYWKEVLRGTTALNLPTDFPRPPIQTHTGAAMRFQIPAHLLQRLHQTSLQEKATLFMVLLSGYLALLHRYTGERNIVVGTPVAGRGHAETQKTIGLFIKTLALRTGLEGNPSFRELIRRVRKTTLEALSNQDIPFEQVVEELRPERSLAQTPIFQVFFNLENIPAPPDRMAGIKIEVLEPEIKHIQYDLSLELHEKGGTIKGVLEYNSDLFKAETIHRMVDHYLSILEHASLDPDQKIGFLPFMKDSEYNRIVNEWNDTLLQYPAESCLHHLFEAQAYRTPEATALIFDQEEITYSELNSRANQFARYLRSQGVGNGSRVGIHVPRSIEMIVSVVAVIKAGATYVPLDIAYPKERLETIALDAEIQFILDGLPQNDLFEELECQVIRLREVGDGLDGYSKANLEDRSNPEDWVYIIYTSGSTGKPKGVPVRHRSVVNYLDYFTRYCKLSPLDTVLQIPPLSFDASVEDIFGTLTSGGKLVLLEEDSLLNMRMVLETIERQEITCILSTVPSFWRAFSSYAAAHPMHSSEVRLITISGEVLYASDCERLWEIFGSETTLINTFGPSECTIITTFYTIPNDLGSDTTIFVGRPIQNTQVYILDEYLSPVPLGVLGEMYIGGVGLAAGYLNQPGLTGESFLPNPFSSEPGSRLYRTGDKVRYLPDGVIDFLGRTDRQVKIRGNRVELGEVEAVLSTHESIMDAVVVPAEDPQNESILLAYLTTKNPYGKPSVSELRSYLQEQLPDYMIPASFITLDNLPLTSSGKVNFQELPAPEENRLDLETSYLPAVTGTEKELVRIWTKYLGVEQIGVQDNFFDLGGHSLMAIRILSEIESTFGMEVPLATLFQATTVQTLAEIISRASSSPEMEYLVPVQPGGTRPPIFCVPPAAATAMRFEKLSKHLIDQPLYGFDYPGMDGKSEPVYSIPELARRFIQEILVLQPEGPYFICGMCYGGNVAFEIAQQLNSQGRQVEFLGIIDSNFPPKRRKPYHYYIYKFRHFIYKDILRKKTEPGDFIKIKREWRFQGTDPLRLQIHKVFRANIFARLAHTSRPYPGKIHKFSTRWQVAERATQKWQKFAAGGLENHIIPGSHSLRSPEDTGIMDEPNVETFARIFEACLADSRKE